MWNLTALVGKLQGGNRLDKMTCLWFLWNINRATLAAHTGQSLDHCFLCFTQNLLSFFAVAHKECWATSALSVVLYIFQYSYSASIFLVFPSPVHLLHIVNYHCHKSDPIFLYWGKNRNPVYLNLTYYGLLRAVTEEGNKCLCRQTFMTFALKGICKLNSKSG